MASAELPQLKKLLIAEGFEIYRTVPGAILLADRVRENLIMDSNVRAEYDPLAVRFVTRAQRSAFGGVSDEQLFESARFLGAEALHVGYSEVEARSVEILDPGDKSRVIDVWHEVAYRKPVGDISELLRELHYALAVEKTASRVSVA